MRILYVSRSHAIDSENESVVTLPLQMFTIMLEYDPELHIDWVVSNKGEEVAKKFKAKLPERLNPIFLNPDVQVRPVGYLLNQEIVDLFDSYDLILNGKLALHQTIQAMTSTPVLGWHLWTATTEQMESIPEYFMGVKDILSECVSVLNGVHVFESVHLKNEILRSLEPYVSKTVLQSNAGNYHVVNLGIDVEKMSAIRETRTNHDRPVIVWGARFANSKRYIETLQLLQRIHSFGVADRIIVTTQTRDTSNKYLTAVAKFKDLEYHPNVGSSEYLEFLKEGTVSICLGKAETYGAGWLEMLYSDLVVVYLRENWQEGVIPPDYPFVVDTIADAEVMLRYVLENLAEAQTMVADSVRKFIEEHHSHRNSSLKLLELMKKEVEKFVP